MFRRGTPIAVFVVAVLVAVAVLLVGGFIVFDLVSEKAHRQQELQSNLDITADQLAASLALPVWNFDRPQLDKIADAAMHGPDIYGIIIRVHAVSSPTGTTIIGRIRNTRWLPAPTDADIPADPTLLPQERNIVVAGDVLGSLKLVGTPVFMRRELAARFVRVTSVSILVGIILMLGLY